MKLKNLGFLGAAAAALGCLLPWITGLAGLISINGSSTPDGKILLVVAIGAGVLALGKSALPNWFAVLAFLGLAGYGMYAIVNITGLNKGIDTTDAWSALSVVSPGVGLYLLVAGGAAGTIGTLSAIGDRRRLPIPPSAS